jgi:hypothetical protein
MRQTKFHKHKNRQNLQFCILLACFSYFEQKVGLWAHHAVCLWTNFRVSKLIFIKLGMHITESEPISVVYFINPSNQSACLNVYPLSLLSKGSVKPLQRQWIHAQQQNRRTCRFLCGPCRIKGKRRLHKYGNLALQVGGVSDETVKYGRDFCGTSTQEWLLWQGPEAIVQVNYRPVLSSERALQNNKVATV